MKIRTNLVSNSSSSSFIIATKGKLPKGKPKQVLVTSMKVPQDSPLYYLVGEMASIMSRATPYTLEELLDEWGYDKTTDAFKYHPILPKAINKGFDTFYYDYASDQEGGTEEILCNIGIAYEDDTVIVDKEASY